MVTHAMTNDTIRQREDRLRAIFKQYFPDPQEMEIYFWDDENLGALDPDFVEQLKNATNVADCNGSFYFSRFDNIEILTMEFFYGLAENYAQRMVRSLIYGPDFEGKETPFIGAASYLSHQGYTWSLAFMLAAKHGFTYEDIYDDIYVYAYHRLFGWAFHEYDDVYRDRLNREDLYEELTRWDARVASRVEQYTRRNTSEANQRMCKAILANAKKYTFTGDDKMGMFINHFGYFPPGARKPIYTDYVFPTYDEEIDTRTFRRKNLEMNLRNAIRQLMIYIFKDNITNPDMRRFKFITLDPKRKVIVVSDSLKEATDEQVYAELAVVLACCNLPVPAPNELPIYYFQSTEEQTTEEKEDSNNADS